jgi:hypothetical protein
MATCLFACVSLKDLGLHLTVDAYALSSAHFRGSLPGEGEDEIEIPVSQPSPMGNPEEDEGIETTTRFNILSYPLFTIDGAVDVMCDSSDPSKSGSGSPSFNPQPWAKLSPPSGKLSHSSSYSMISAQSIPLQKTVSVYPSNPCTPPSPRYNRDPLPREGHLPIGHLSGYATHSQNHGFLGRPHQDVKPLIKQEYVEDNRYW